MSTSLVFPGMGPASYSELGKFLVTDPCARQLRRAADAVLGYPLMDRYRTSGEDYSEYSQIAFLISCLALAEYSGDVLDGDPIACTGPSFGEKTAVAYTGVLPFPEAVLMTARLARCEAEYFRTEHQDVITQSVARTPGPALAEILGAMTDRHEWHDISCHVDADFFMVSLRMPSLERFLREVRAAGGLPLYTMRPPMHSAAFGALRRKAEDEVLGDLPLGDPRLPIIADTDGSVIGTADSVRAMLLDTFIRPVRWPEVVRTMKSLGITKVGICGPDSLFGRVHCTIQNFEVRPINTRMALRPRIMTS